MSRLVSKSDGFVTVTPTQRLRRGLGRGREGSRGRCRGNVPAAWVSGGFGTRDGTPSRRSANGSPYMETPVAQADPGCRRWCAGGLVGGNVVRPVGRRPCRGRGTQWADPGWLRGGGGAVGRARDAPPGVGDWATPALAANAA